MISSPLFRAGDKIHWRKDLCTGTQYDTLFCGDASCHISSYAYDWVGSHAGRPVDICGISRYSGYLTFEFEPDGLPDTLFDETMRVARFLNMEGGNVF